MTEGVPSKPPFGCWQILHGLKVRFTYVATEGLYDLVYNFCLLLLEFQMPWSAQAWKQPTAVIPAHAAVLAYDEPSHCRALHASTENPLRLNQVSLFISTGVFQAHSHTPA